MAGSGAGEAVRGVFERFTDEARRVVVAAQEHARMMGHDYIGPEHILLGLVRAGDDAAARVLTGLGAGPEQVRQRLTELLGEPPARPFTRFRRPRRSPRR